MEEWKDVVGYEGLYQVSSFGNVKRDDHILKTWLAGGKGNKWYDFVSLSMNGIVKKKKVSIMTATAFHLNPTNLPIVDHLNGNTRNNKIENLSWVTRRGNWLNPTNSVRPVGSSGQKCIFKNHDNFMVRCNLNGIKHYIGSFKTLEEAIRARDTFLNK